MVCLLMRVSVERPKTERDPAVLQNYRCSKTSTTPPPYGGARLLLGRR